jgi:hypothetical protein
MSVIMTLRIEGDAKKLEEHVAADPDAMRDILDHAKKHGVIAHRFYGTDDGKIMVADEWPSPEDFQAFFEHMGPQIQQLMAAAGVTKEPEVTFWRKLDTGDDLGWGA